jgi:hypothetical protein
VLKVPEVYLRGSYVLQCKASVPVGSDIQTTGKEMFISLAAGCLCNNGHTVQKQSAALPLSILQFIPVPCLSGLICNFSIRLSVTGITLADPNINSFQRNVLL